MERDTERKRADKNMQARALGWPFPTVNGVKAESWSGVKKSEKSAATDFHFFSPLVLWRIPTSL